MKILVEEMPFYEIFCGFSSSLLIAPIMTIIDTAIIKSQVSKQSLKPAIVSTIEDYSSKKMKFNRPFSVMFFVYSSTYSTANLTNYYCKKTNTDSKIPTLVSTSLVNIASISYKDREYTKLFQTQKSYFPKSSYGLFALRDMLTIAACFTFKNDAIHKLNKYMPHNLADFVASLTLPMFIQTISTPLHILAIDLYQRPLATNKERLQHIQKLYTSVCSGRIIRVIPAFCLGGFVNDMLRERVYEN